MIKKIYRIDSDEIDLENEREVKKEFVALEQELSEVKAKDK